MMEFVSMFWELNPFPRGNQTCGWFAEDNGEFGNLTLHLFDMLGIVLPDTENPLCRKSEFAND
jgi:hypothetical protein